MINNVIKLLGSSTTPVVNNQSTVYFFNKQNNTKFGPGWKNIVNKILIAYFKQLNSLISQPVFTIYPNKVKIHLFYYMADLGSIMPKESKGEFKYYLHRIGKIEKDLADSEKLNLTTDQLQVLNEAAKLITKNGKSPRYLNTLRRSRKVKLWSYLIKLHLAYLKVNRLRDLTIFLSKYLKINVELELVQLIHPYHDSNILAQLIAINGRTLTYRKIKKTRVI